MKDLEDGFGLECLIANPTRITKLSSTLIDVILTKRPDILQRVGPIIHRSVIIALYMT